MKTGKYIEHGSGPHILIARDGSQARCAGNPEQCKWCALDSDIERIRNSSLPKPDWVGDARHLNWLKLMVDPEGGFYFDNPAKDAIKWAIEKIDSSELIKKSSRGEGL